MNIFTLNRTFLVALEVWLSIIDLMSIKLIPDWGKSINVQERRRNV
jgi:hypothetical protein